MKLLNDIESMLGIGLLAGGAVLAYKYRDQLGTWWQSIFGNDQKKQDPKNPNDPFAFFQGRGLIDYSPIIMLPDIWKYAQERDKTLTEQLNAWWNSKFGGITPPYTGPTLPADQSRIGIGTTQKKDLSGVLNPNNWSTTKTAVQKPIPVSKPESPGPLNMGSMTKASDNIVSAVKVWTPSGTDLSKSIVPFDNGTPINVGGSSLNKDVIAWNGGLIDKTTGGYITGYGPKIAGPIYPGSPEARLAKGSGSVGTLTDANYKPPVTETLYTDGNNISNRPLGSNWYAISAAEARARKLI